MLELRFSFGTDRGNQLDHSAGRWPIGQCQSEPPWEVEHLCSSFSRWRRLDLHDPGCAVTKAVKDSLSTFQFGPVDYDCKFAIFRHTCFTHIHNAHMDAYTHAPTYLHTYIPPYQHTFGPTHLWNGSVYTRKCIAFYNDYGMNMNKCDLFQTIFSGGFCTKIPHMMQVRRSSSWNWMKPTMCMAVTPSWT